MSAAKMPKCKRINDPPLPDFLPELKERGNPPYTIQKDSDMDDDEEEEKSNYGWYNGQYVPGTSPFPKPPVHSAAAAAVMASNDLLSKDMLLRLKASFRKAMKSDQTMVGDVIQRVAFDGRTVPPELKDCSFWWYEKVTKADGLQHMVTRYVRDATSRNSSSHPLSKVPCWCYKTVELPLEQVSVRMEWKVTAAEISRLMAFWKYKSALTVSPNCAASVDECRGTTAKKLAGTKHGGKLRLMVWVLHGISERLERVTHEPIRSGESPPEFQLCFDKNNYSFKSLTLHAYDIVPVTKHEAAALSQRPNLLAVIRNCPELTESFDQDYSFPCDSKRLAFYALVHYDWHREDRGAHNEDASEKDVGSAAPIDSWLQSQGELRGDASEKREPVSGSQKAKRLQGTLTAAAASKRRALQAIRADGTVSDDGNME